MILSIPQNHTKKKKYNPLSKSTLITSSPIYQPTPKPDLNTTSKLNINISMHNLINYFINQKICSINKKSMIRINNKSIESSNKYNYSKKNPFFLLPILATTTKLNKNNRKKWKKSNLKWLSIYKISKIKSSNSKSLLIPN